MDRNKVKNIFNLCNGFLTCIMILTYIALLFNQHCGWTYNYVIMYAFYNLCMHFIMYAFYSLTYNYVR